MGSTNISMSNHGFDIDLYWDAPYGSSSAYVYWVVNSNSYGRTFNLVQRSNTSNRYNSGSNVPFGEYCLYVYKNGSYATQSSWINIQADAPPKYTVSYNNGGRGTAPSSQSATSGSSITLRGKMSNVAGTSYTVKYNANGGDSTPDSSTSTQTYTHTKWAKGSTSGTQYNPGASYTVTGNTTMYGIWSGSRTAVTLPAAITMGDSYYFYNVYYDVNGGNSATPANHALTRSHTNTFAGWNTAQDGSGTTYAAKASFTPSANNTTLYAKWTKGTLTGSTTLAAAATKNDTTQTGYKITFNANGGSCSTTSLTATDTVKWTFNKWNTKADGTGTAYSAGASYSTDAHVTLYATWNSSVTRGSINLPTPTRSGYTFKGWATSSSATSGSTGTYTPDATRTLYAIWGQQTYPVTYNANGHGTAPATQTKTHGENLTLRSFIAQDTSTGYTVSFNKNNGNSTPNSKTSTLTHTQTSWNTKSDGSGTEYASGATYTANAAATLYAIWSTSNGAITLPAGIARDNSTTTGYKVTFDATGGTCTTTYLTSQKTATYEFDKWTVGSVSGTRYDANASFTPTADTTMYATWAVKYTYGSINLPTPTRTGYTFKGWSTSKSATSGVTGTYTPTAATTLYATWQIDTWTVSYNANGHGTAPSSQTKTYGAALILRPFISQQTATGYTVSFNRNGGTTTPSSLTSTIYYNQTNWNTKANGSGTNYASQDSYTTNGANTMYAIWSTSNGSVTLPSAISRSQSTTNGYTVTFNANGGSCGTTSLTATNTTTYTFAGWSYNGTTYAAGASYTPTAATTMTANWSTSTTLGSITLPAASKSGYTFVGWGTSSAATSGVTGTYTPNGNVTLYAVYSANGYTVAYNANGYGTAPANQTKTHGSNLTLQPFIADQSGPGYTVSFNKNGGDSTPGNLTSSVTKKQTNWNTNSNGTGTSYGSQGTYSSDASTTLYAIWSTTNGSVTLPAAITRKTTNEDGYKVTLNANGGVCSETELDQVIITSYTFDKWAQGSTSGTKYAAGASFTPTAATTMYATWTEKVGRSSVDLPTPTRDGYTFAGWGTSASATSGVTGEYLPTSNITLYAIWKKNGSLIHYNNNGVDTLCEVYYNNNGTAVLCNVYYNNNGAEVKI